MLYLEDSETTSPRKEDSHMIEIRWHGRGGQGAFTASKLLGAAAVAQEKYALSFPSFGPERRGAPIQAFTKIDDKPITDRSVISHGDYIVFLDETLYDASVKKSLKEGGKIFLNTKEPSKYADAQVVAVDADAISERIIGRPVSNTAMLAVLIAHTSVVSAESVKSVLASFLPGKIVEKNKAVIDEILAREGGQGK